MKNISESKITPVVIANFFLTKDKLSPKKLQKLTYYAYAWFIALNNQDADHIDNYLFNEQPEAWLHGPVFPSLYHEYKEFGWHEVPKNRKFKIDDKNLKAFLDDVWDKYGEFTADQLEYMTHQEDPWRKARAGAEEFSSSKAKISKEEIYIFYNSLIQKA